MKAKKQILFFTLFFIFSIAINIVHPVTTDYVTSLELPDYYFGFFFSLMSLGQVIGGLVFGILSDKIGRKWLIVIGIIGYCLAQACFGFINSWPALILVFRVLSGIFVSAPNALFLSMCIDYSTTEEKVKNLSIMSFCSILGASLGYEIGGSLLTYAHFSIGQIFITQVIVGLVAASVFAIFIIDYKKTENRGNNKKKNTYDDNPRVIRTEDGKHLIPKNNRMSTIKTEQLFNFKVYYTREEKNYPYTLSETSKHYGINREIKAPVIFYFLLFAILLMTVGQVLVNKYLDPFFIHSGHKAAELGHYVLITGVIGAFSNLIFIPIVKKVKRIKGHKLLASFLLISAITVLLTFLVPVNLFYMLFSTHLVYIILKALITPLEQNECANHIYEKANNAGRIMGARQTVLSIGNVAGPLIGSAVYTKASPTIFIVAAIILLVSLVVYLIYFQLEVKTKIRFTLWASVNGYLPFGYLFIDKKEKDFKVRASSQPNLLDKCYGERYYNLGRFGRMKRASLVINRGQIFAVDDDKNPTKLVLDIHPDKPYILTNGMLLPYENKTYVRYNPKYKFNITNLKKKDKHMAVIFNGMLYSGYKDDQNEEIFMIYNHSALSFIGHYFSIGERHHQDGGFGKKVFPDELVNNLKIVDFQVQDNCFDVTLNYKGKDYKTVLSIYTLADLATQMGVYKEFNAKFVEQLMVLTKDLKKNSSFKYQWYVLDY